MFSSVGAFFFFFLFYFDLLFFSGFFSPKIACSLNFGGVLSDLEVKVEGRIETGREEEDCLSWWQNFVFFNLNEEYSGKCGGVMVDLMASKF